MVSSCQIRRIALDTVVNTIDALDENSIKTLVDDFKGVVLTSS